MRLRALVLLTALGATLLPAGAGQAADPAGSVETAVLGLETQGYGGDVFRELATFELPGGPRQALPGLTGNGTRFLEDLAVSRSGDRIAYRDAVDDAIEVRDLSGAGIARIDPLPQVTRDSTTPRRAAGPGLALSPDGNQVVFRRQTEVGCTVARSELLVAPADGGTPRTLLRTEGSTGYYDPVFLTDTLLVVGIGTPQPVSDSTCFTGSPTVLTSYRTLGLDGTLGPAVAVPPTPDGDRRTSVAGLSFNEDSTAVVFERGFPGSAFPATVRLETAPVVLTAQGLTIGAAKVLTAFDPGDVVQAREPRFTRDGSHIVYLRNRQLVSQPSTGGTETVLDRVAEAEVASAGIEALVLGFRESVAPASAPVLQSAVSSGPTLRLTYAVGADPTAGLIRLTRAVAGGATTALTFPLAGATGQLVDRVPVGRSITYTAQVQDRSGNLGPTSSTAVSTSPPGSAAASGSVLLRRQQLRSPAGHNAQLGADGNFVVYAPSAAVLFQTRTRGATSLRVQRDGNLVLVNGLGRVFWQSRTGGQGPAGLVLQRDGNLVLYRDSDGKALWSSKTA